MHYQKGKPETEMYVVFIGSLKKLKKDNYFSEEEMGQLLDQMRALIIRQHRDFVVGYITDSKNIQFFQLTLKKAEFTVKNTRPIPLRNDDGENGDGGKMLLTLLLNNDYSSLGFNTPELRFKTSKRSKTWDVVDIAAYLGEGRFARAYLTHNGKIVKVHQEAEVSTEAKNLKQLRNHLRSCGDKTFTFPQLLGISQCQKALLVIPKGIKFCRAPTNACML